MIANVQQNTATFKAFYKYCFSLCAEGSSRRLDVEVASNMLVLICSKRFPTLLPKFCDFLVNTRIATSGEESRGKEAPAMMKCDEWAQLLPFMTKYEAEGLDAFDENSSWPVLRAGASVLRARPLQRQKRRQSTQSWTHTAQSPPVQPSRTSR